MDKEVLFKSLLLSIVFLGCVIGLVLIIITFPKIAIPILLFGFFWALVYNVMKAQKDDKRLD